MSDFQEKDYSSETARLAIEQFIHRIPNPDRKQAISLARRSREEFLLQFWTLERSKLSHELVNNNGFTPDLKGWQRYLNYAYKRLTTNLFRVKDMKDFSAKYLASMTCEYARDYDWNLESNRLKFKIMTGSYSDHYQQQGGFADPAICWGITEGPDRNSLLVHSLSQKSLLGVINSGRLGRGGLATAAFCQDRVVYDDGYIIVYQANDLIAAGYPLLRINEDGRDAKILREWRSAIAVDINLARLITSTDVIPDRANASRAQIATSYFGEEYLKAIPRL